MLVLVNSPSPRLNNCELTFSERCPIDFELACKQHLTYVQALTSAGAQVRVLEVNVNEPDGVFVEDVAVLLGEVAILTSMGAEARRRESAALRGILSSYCTIREIKLPAMLEGGDVMRIGNTLFVGESTRTNSAGISELAYLVSDLDYQVVVVPVKKCLHLKTGVTAIGPSNLLLNPDWIDGDSFPGFDIIEVHAEEPAAANTLSIGSHLLVNNNFPKTLKILERQGYQVVPVDISEFVKAEAGLTCMSLVFER